MVPSPRTRLLQAGVPVLGATLALLGGYGLFIGWFARQGVRLPLDPDVLRWIVPTLLGVALVRWFVRPHLQGLHSHSRLRLPVFQCPLPSRWCQ